MNENMNELNYDNVRYFSKINPDSHKHFLLLLNNASKRIVFFGLTCNFYLSESIKKIIIQKSQEIPIKILILHPQSKYRVERYKFEPAEVKYRDPKYFNDNVIKPYQKLKYFSEKLGTNKLEIYLYDFLPYFGFELIDNIIRVRLYGYMKRGTDSPIFVLSEKSDIFTYFKEQIQYICTNPQLISIENYKFNSDSGF